MGKMRVLTLKGQVIDLWQKYMNEALARYRDENDLGKVSYEDFLDAIDANQREAVLLGNFNYQVLNGGFEGWVGNGYGLEAKEVVSILEKIPGDTIDTVINLIEQVIP